MERNEYKKQECPHFDPTLPPVFEESRVTKILRNRSKNADNTTTAPTCPPFSETNSIVIKKEYKNRGENKYIVNNREKVGATGGRDIKNTPCTPPELAWPEYADFCRTVLRAMGKPITVGEYLRQQENGVDFAVLFFGISKLLEVRYCYRQVYNQIDEKCTPEHCKSYDRKECNFFTPQKERTG